jgi:hypothetical protein
VINWVRTLLIFFDNALLVYVRTEQKGFV